MKTRSVMLGVFVLWCLILCHPSMAGMSDGLLGDPRHETLETETFSLDGFMAKRNPDGGVWMVDMSSGTGVYFQSDGLIFCFDGAGRVIDRGLWDLKTFKITGLQGPAAKERGCFNKAWLEVKQKPSRGQSKKDDNPADRGTNTTKSKTVVEFS